VGFSLGEIFLLVLVGIIVVGPKRLPGLMRTAGQYVARLRRMSTDLRSQSGIDDLLRQEGLDQHIQELRSLSRFNVVETLMTPGAAPPVDALRHVPPGPLDTPAAKLDRPRHNALPALATPRPFTWQGDEPLREREYPLAGCDAYGALPDDAAMYTPPSAPTNEAPPASEAKPASSTEPEAETKPKAEATPEAEPTSERAPAAHAEGEA
jgi:sec-independent protein translocase protein TatB